MEALIAFYHALPGELLTLLAVAIGTTSRAIKNKQTGVAVGLVTIIINATIGYGMIWYLDRRDYAAMKEIWFFGALAGYLASYLLGGLETAGQQFEKKPIPTATKWFIDFVEQIYSRYKTLKQNEK